MSIKSERTPSLKTSRSSRPVRYTTPPTEAVNSETPSTTVSLATQNAAIVSSAGYSNAKRSRRACDSSTMPIIILAIIFHRDWNTIRIACKFSAKRLPMLHSGLRILTRVPTHLCTPHRAAAKHLLCTSIYLGSGVAVWQPTQLSIRHCRVTCTF